ncbi:hypothetical protein J5S49_13520 [Virgibacillus halodenitrificans]|uniref:hypothetical protein n=1 Tax=Virgibacillus halodenitrificans TaxID=1482 RepID=UPI001F3CB3CD|nr:hypothetical protein [Virgibacillus halodenitrificans]MCG1029311.1 hypothetical protein [Virgibacillus halodenitrificans]
MINLKDDILNSLESNTNLTNQLDQFNGLPAVFPNRAPANQNFDTYAIYQLINNVDIDYADNKPLREYIHYQVSIFTKQGSTTSLGEEVKNSMQSLGFFRTYIGEMFESDTGYTHISTRWKIKLRKEVM